MNCMRALALHLIAGLGKTTQKRKEDKGGTELDLLWNTLFLGVLEQLKLSFRNGALKPGRHVAAHIPTNSPGVEAPKPWHRNRNCAGCDSAQ